jgi:hypothetical protein
LDPLPDDVLQFLQSHIDSIEQLELLRVLGEHPAREWSDTELGGSVQVAGDTLEAHLAALHNRGMLSRIRRDEKYCWKYGPATADLEAKVRRLLEVYSQRPVTMIRLVYQRPASALRVFSDAFRLRKGE